MSARADAWWERIGWLRRVTLFPLVPANLAGAIIVYLYFTWVDLPSAGSEAFDGPRDLTVFLGVALAVLVLTMLAARAFVGPVEQWSQALRRGVQADEVPIAIRRRAINAPLVTALLSMASWGLAIVIYIPYLTYFGQPAIEVLRNVAGMALVAAPITAAVTFLGAEFHWRREIPLFFPDGRVEVHGVLRVPIRVRMAATFILTSVVPIVVILATDLSFQWRFAPALRSELRPMWDGLLRTHVYIAAMNAVASVVMALLVARFINRPVQALREAMQHVADGDLETIVPVRSTDELGELNQHFNEMLSGLRDGKRAQELFGRYVSPAVAEHALASGIELGGEAVHATAMFIDLRGFTSLAARASATHVVALLNDYYALVERVCEHEGGIVTQFLGDGVVVVFGGPLRPLPDHATRAVAAAVALQRTIAERNTHPGNQPIAAGIGLCTGMMIAGNVGAGERVAYTIVGDAVNQAARLQVKTRELGASILATDSTIRAVGLDPTVRVRSMGPQPLKGISTPVEVYAVEA